MPFVFVALLLWQSAVPDPLRQGLLSLNRGDTAGALSSLEVASRQSPDNAIVWAALAQTYFRSGDKVAALGAAQKAEALAPDAPAIQHALAMFYTGIGEPGKAARFERQFASSPQADSEALGRAAQLFLKAADSSEALEAAQAAVAQHGTPANHFVLGQAYEAANQPAPALNEYRAAASGAPESAEFSFALAQSYLRLQKFGEAAGLLEQSVKRSPADAQLRLALGVAQYGLRRFPEAVQSFLATIDAVPDLEQPYVFLSKMLDQAGTALPAVQSKFEQFHARHPDNGLGSFLLAKVLAMTGGATEQLKPLLQDAIAKDAGNWEAHAELASVLSRERNFQEAAAEFEIAQKLNQSEASIPFRLARVYDRLQQPDKAAAQRALHQRLLTPAKAGMERP